MKRLDVLVDKAQSLSSEVEEKKGVTPLSLYREETIVQGKDGEYHALRVTFAALTDFEKSELFRLVRELGILPEQLQYFLENSCRQSVIILIFNKEKNRVVATGQINWVKSFGSPELGVTRLGTFFLTHAVVEKEYRGKHLGKALLTQRFAILESGFFEKYAQQSSPKELLLGKQKIDNKKLVTKRMLRQAIRKKNLLVVCELRDEVAHFGRCVEAAKVIGLKMTEKAQRVMQSYEQLVIREDKDYVFISVYSGLPADNFIKGVRIKSRYNDQQSLYFFGDAQLRSKLYQDLIKKLTQLGAKYNPDLCLYNGISADDLWQMVDQLIQSKEYEVLIDQQDNGAVLEEFKLRFKESEKLHLVTVRRFQTYRFAAGF